MTIPDSFVIGKSEAIDRQVQSVLKDAGLYKLAIDGKFFGESRKALAKWDANNGISRGDGSWGWVARIDGTDLVVTGVKATCFGGTDDPQDNGDTASGISTRKNPSLEGCALPMNGRSFPGIGPKVHAALDGSPIPRMTWQTIVRVTHGEAEIDVPVIDLGPGKQATREGSLPHAIDLTIAAARQFDPKATATNFNATVNYRILGGAYFVTT